MAESFEGLGPRAVVDEYRVAKNELSYEPEVLSSYTKPDLKKADGRYPCLVMKKQRDARISLRTFEVAIDNCLQKSFIDGDVDEIEVDLRSGLVMVRKTDFFVPGTAPVAVTRCYRSWDSQSRTFGRNTALSWDMYPLGDMDSYTYMDLYLCDGNKIHFERISKGSGFADVLYEHRQTATPFFGSRLRWNGDAWHLKRIDKAELFFPGTYNARRGVDGGLTQFRSSTGMSVKIERDRRRNLRRLVASNQTSIQFEYDWRDRVSKAFDDNKRVVNYFYDVAGRLVEIQSPDSTSRFNYDYEDVTSIYENGHRLVEFKYPLGLVEQISLADGRIYKIRYDSGPDGKSVPVHTYLTLPDGTVHKFGAKPE